MTREMWEKRRWEWQVAMVSVADKCGKDSEIYRSMGSLAWGRYPGEPSASENKDHVVFGCGYLEGVRDALLKASGVGGWDGQRLLRYIHDDIRRASE